MIGEALRRLREEADATIEDVAETSGVEATVLEAIEYGILDPPFSAVSEVVTALSGWARFGQIMDEREFHHHVDVEGVSPEARVTIEEFMAPLINDGRLKTREAIQKSFEFALGLCPTANASDLWHHIIYRAYLRKKEGSDPAQSWVRTSGEAFELVLANRYNEYLQPRNLRLVPVFSRSAKSEALRRMGISDRVSASKIDLLIQERSAPGEEWVTKGGVHAKVSLAERVSDDIPASRIMMEEDLISALLTMDVKSFPPPHGDLVNRGELGSPAAPSDKRRYVEEHGDFDICVSYNERTSPSEGEPPSGKRISLGDLREQPDAFTRFLEDRLRPRSS